MKCAKIFLVIMLSVPGVLITLKLIADILSIKCPACRQINALCDCD